MSEWKETKLQKIVDIQNGYAFKSEDFDTQGVPVIKIKNIASGKMIWDDIQFYSKSLTGLDKFIIRHNDILISMTGSHVTQISSAVGKVTRYSSINQSLLNQRVGKIYSLNSNHLNNDFLYYFLIQTTIQYQLGLSASGSANQANISPSNIKELLILLPSLSEQNRITDILSCLDTKIENLRRQNETLEQIAQTLFKHWFIDFEFPNADGKPYKSSGGAMFASELGDIPKVWKIGKLGDYISVKHGYAFKGEYITTEETQQILLTPVNFKIGGGFNDSKYKFYSDEHYPDDYILNKNDLTITMTDLSKEGDALGYPAFIPEVKEKIFLHNQRIGKIENHKIDKVFLYFLLCRREYRSHILGTSSGSTVRHTSPSRICDFCFTIPDFKLIERFSNIAKSTIDKILINFEQVETLTKTRDSLLPKLMSGQLRVKE